MKSYFISKKYYFLLLALILTILGATTLFLTNQFFTPKTTCEIIITQNDNQHINELKKAYPNCKIIFKDNLHKYDVIDMLLQLFK